MHNNQALSHRIEVLAALGDEMQKACDAPQAVFRQANQENAWFTEDNIKQSVQAIASKMLNKDNLETWTNPYQEQIAKNISPKTVGLVMAGNIPLVGFHDMLTVLITGNKAQIKLSSKDKKLLPFVKALLEGIDPVLAGQISFSDQLKGFDAIIATGNDNSARYFEYYFGKYPHIIRKNRGSVAIITGDETRDDFIALGHDIFDYFGLGCRNVSKVYFPEGYDMPRFLDGLAPFENVMDHNKYKNNYDYYRSVFLLNRLPHFASDYLMLLPETAVSSRISTLHYGFYGNEASLHNELALYRDDIQCLVSKNKKLENFILPGQTQQPELWDYADHVNTVAFLTGL
jgi:Acyl-CoA reductase (LuxC)